MQHSAIIQPPRNSPMEAAHAGCELQLHRDQSLNIIQVSRLAGEKKKIVRVKAVRREAILKKQTPPGSRQPCLWWNAASAAPSKPELLRRDVRVPTILIGCLQARPLDIAFMGVCVLIFRIVEEVVSRAHVAMLACLLLIFWLNCGPEVLIEFLYVNSARSILVHRIEKAVGDLPAVAIGFEDVIHICLAAFAAAWLRPSLSEGLLDCGEFRMQSLPDMVSNVCKHFFVQ